MFLWFENHSVFTLKPSVIASLNGSAAQTSKRSAAMIKNKAGGDAASAIPASGASNAAQPNAASNS